MKTADQMAKAYLDAMSSGKASANYVQGINGYNGNPMALAASPEAMQRYVSGVQDSVNSGRRAAALNAASPATWKTNATTVGAQRLATGAQKAMPKIVAHFQKYAPVYAQMRSVVQGMPKGGMANAAARWNAAMQVLMAASGKS